MGEDSPNRQPQGVGGLAEGGAGLGAGPAVFGGGSIRGQGAGCKLVAVTPLGSGHKAAGADADDQ